MPQNLFQNGLLIMSVELIEVTEKIIKTIENKSLTLFQDPKWLEIISKSYGHSAFYCIVSKNGQRVFLPIIRIKDKFIALPFIDYVEAFSSSDFSESIYTDIVNYFSCKQLSLHFRFQKKLPDNEGIFVNTSNIIQTLPLKKNSVLQWNSLSAKVRNQIRKFENSGITITDDDSYLEGFYSLWAKRISSLGTPPHSFEFFDNIFSHLKSHNRILLTAWLEKKIVGGLVLLFDQNRAYVPWASADKNFMSYCVNHGLYWKAIRMALELGKIEFDFLRSQKGSGPYYYKKQWGAEEVPLYYYSNCKSKDPHANKMYKIATFIWKIIPSKIALIVGPCLRKNIP